MITITTRINKSIFAVKIQQCSFFFGEGGDIVQCFAVLPDAGEDGFQVVDHDFGGLLKSERTSPAPTMTSTMFQISRPRATLKNG